MSKGGDSPSGTTTTTNISDPWSGQQPYLTAGFQQAQNLFNQGGPSYYPGQSYAGPTDLQQTGIENEANIGLNGTNAQNAANGSLSNILNQSFLSSNPSNGAYGSAASGGMNVNTGNLFSPLATGAQTNTMGVNTLYHIANGENLSSDNPYFQQMANTVKANVLPGIQAGFNGGNRLDSGLATRAAAEGLGDSIGGLAYNNYQQGLQQQQSAASNLANIGQNNIGNQLAASTALTNLGFGNVGTQLAGAQGQSQNFENAAGNQLGALGIAPSINNLDYQQAAALQDAGKTTQGFNQAAITDAMNRYNYTQQQPYANLQNYMQNIQGNYGGTQTQTSPYFQNGTANALSTGLGAFSLGNALTGNQLSGGLSNLFGSLFGGGGASNDLGSWLAAGF